MNPSPMSSTPVIEMKVTERGFEPDVLQARAGEELMLRVTRTFARTCAQSFEVPGLHGKTRLPLGEAVTIRLTPTRAGAFRFGCAMGQHIGGTLVVDE